MFLIPKKSFLSFFSFIFLCCVLFQWSPLNAQTSNALTGQEFQENQLVPYQDMAAKLPKSYVSDKPLVENNFPPINTKSQVPTPQKNVVSPFEKYVAGDFSKVPSLKLEQFGYDFFDNPASSFLPSEKIAVGPDYIVGVGDEIKVTIWGKLDAKWTLVVEKDGSISLPKIGVITVAGLSFVDLKAKLHREVSQYYSGFELNVSMGALRTMRVYVLGKAKRPGAYSVSSLSTLVSALFQSGGPSKAGSMRNVEVKRNGKTIVRFSLYDLLLKGDKTKDIRLAPEDIIFIQPIGALAAIAGSVNAPGIYEVQDETVEDLIRMAGGLSDLAFKGRIQLDRINDNAYQAVSEVSFVQAKALKVRGGDIVKIYPVNENKFLVHVNGAVQREGDFGFTEGMRVADLVSLAGGLKYFADPKEVELTRVSLLETGPSMTRLKINIQEVIQNPESSSNITLQQNDSLSIRSIPEWELYGTVKVSGEVKYPGVYSLKKNETLLSLLQRAGGYTDQAYLEGSVFTRAAIRVQQQKSLEDISARMEIELGLTRSSLNDNGAEELQKKALLDSIKNVKAKGRLTIKLSNLNDLENSPYNIVLQANDELVVPRNPQMIYVLGGIYNRQSAFIFNPGKSVDDYVAMSAGFTDAADPDKVFVIHADGSAERVPGGFFIFRSGMKISAGDTIVVPEKINQPWLRGVKDVTEILYQIAVTTGVVLNATK